MSNDSKGYYKVLGLAPGASVADVKKANKKKQVQLHPAGACRKQLHESAAYKALTDDQKARKNKEIDDELAAVNEAVNVLEFEDKKREYDEGTGQYSEFDMGGMGGGGFGDIFSYFAGRGGRQQKKQYKVPDTVVKVTLTLKDVFTGKTNKYRVNTKKSCKACSGKGAKDVVSCSKCGGQGTVYMQRKLGVMITRTEVECPDCKGAGKCPKGPICCECKGEGTCTDPEYINVVIRPGIQDGETIRYLGKGNQCPGCENGNLIFRIFVSPNDKFSRVDDHLVSQIDVDLLTALTGGVCYFEHIDGRKLAVKVGPFKNFNDVICVSKEGFKDGRNENPKDERDRGDLFLRPNVIINQNLDRARLSEYIKPMLSKPYGEYQNTASSVFKKMPEASHRESEEEGPQHADPHDFFNSFRFF